MTLAIAIFLYVMGMVVIMTLIKACEPVNSEGEKFAALMMCIIWPIFTFAASLCGAYKLIKLLIKKAVKK